jgi:hypothetical protein
VIGAGVVSTVVVVRGVGVDASFSPGERVAVAVLAVTQGSSKGNASQADIAKINITPKTRGILIFFKSLRHPFKGLL